MMENITNTTSNNQAPLPKVLTMVKNERMAGHVPKWAAAEPDDSNIAQNIESSLYTHTNESNNALSYRGDQAKQTSEAFGFSDLLDMVNPLHHVPVLGHAYRELTGDEIKPIGRIIGGAAFSGPLGAASALMDTVVIQETGKDITSNAFDLAFNDATPSQTNTPETTPQPVQNALNEAVNRVNDENIASTLLSFSDLGANSSKIKIEKSNIVDSRTAGSFEKITHQDIKPDTLPQREPITQVRFTGKTGLYAL